MSYISRMRELCVMYQDNILSYQHLHNILADEHLHNTLADEHLQNILSGEQLHNIVADEHLFNILCDGKFHKIMTMLSLLVILYFLKIFHRYHKLTQRLCLTYQTPNIVEAYSLAVSSRVKQM